MGAPLSIGIIMDGNRRWAEERGMRPWDGHRAGAETLKRVVAWALERGGIGSLFLYAFSTENWKRDQKEIEYLFELIAELFEQGVVAGGDLARVRIRIVGEKNRFPERMQKIFSDIEQRTSTHTPLTVWFGLSYGGRAEIVAAAASAAAAGVPITEESVRDNLWTAKMPDPDLIIRTGGEQRLSNFLTWGGVYSELFFCPTYWPAFSKDEFFSIIEQFQKRQRRMGK